MLRQIAPRRPRLTRADIFICLAGEGRKCRNTLPSRPPPATALPLPETRADDPKADDAFLMRQLSAPGCPGFTHLRPRKANPAAVVLMALLRKDLETRLAEALPWILLMYPDLDWHWLIRRAKDDGVRLQNERMQIFPLPLSARRSLGRP